jgi:hypothetical protein
LRELPPRSLLGARERWNGSISTLICGTIRLIAITNSIAIAMFPAGLSAARLVEHPRGEEREDGG